MLKIMVSSNCQTAGVGAALQHLFPAAQINMMPVPAIGAIDENEFVANRLSAVDIWITSGLYHLADRISSKTSPASLKTIRIPSIEFKAFHPDLIYVKDASTDRLSNYHYNSAIAAWCYKHGVSAKDAVGLFNEGAFSNLGYFSEWDNCVDYMRKRFDDVQFEFADLFIKVKRLGLFMNSSNHPKAFTLTELAKHAAIMIGESRSVLNRKIEVNDGLLGYSWPVYPEIADFYGLDCGSYNWFVTGNYLSSILDYVEFAFAQYRNQDLLPANMKLFADEPKYDRILGAVLGRPTT